MWITPFSGVYFSRVNHRSDPEKIKKIQRIIKFLGDSLITTTTINSGGWKDEPHRTPTIHDFRREIRRIPSGTRHS
jgi:hypothetical protein